MDDFTRLFVLQTISKSTRDLKESFGKKLLTFNVLTISHTPLQFELCSSICGCNINYIFSRILRIYKLYCVNYQLWLIIMVDGLQCRIFRPIYVHIYAHLYTYIETLNVFIVVSSPLDTPLVLQVHGDAIIYDSFPVFIVTFPVYVYIYTPPIGICSVFGLKNQKALHFFLLFSSPILPRSPSSHHFAFAFE